MGERQGADVLLEVRDLRTHFFTQSGVVKAVDGVSFELRRGETLGIVGESGSGKSITALSLMRLVPRPGRIVGGQISLHGRDLLALKETEMERVRGGEIAIVLQDPMTSLNPVLTIGDQVSETLKQHQRGSSARERAGRVLELLRQVRIPAPELRVKNYPHQLSGGMRQRVAGAIAISCQPEVLIADEPTTSLDVTIQLQYLRLLRQIQHDTGLSIVFITHDFGIVAKMCDRVAVMYAGRIVETGPVREIFARPSHPYTRALLDSLPSVDREVDRLASIPGQPPVLYDLPPGCPFAPRCALVQPRCREDYPPAMPVEPAHTASCWMA